MSMNASSASGEDGEMSPVAEINVTPMVDIMLVLLIIFMVTAPLMMAQLPINLPKESTEQPPKPPKDPIIISLDNANNYTVDAGGGNVTVLPADQIAARIKDLSVSDPTNIVLVKADESVPYGSVMDLLSLVSTSGFSKISIMPQTHHA
jgi:biopolymer transport protein ExbD